MTNSIVDRPIVVREFIPNKKKPIFNLFRVNMLSLILFVLLIGACDFSESRSLLSTFANIGFGLSGVTFLITKFAAIFSRESLNGHFGGKLKFSNKGIDINKTFYAFNDIQDISINLNHYNGERRSGITSHAAIFNGVDNKLSFRIGGLYNYVSFQINSAAQLLDFIDYLKLLDDTIKINFSYKDRQHRVRNFDLKLYGLYR